MIVRPVLCRPFIGRLQELAYLRERRLEAARSHGGLVLITGDAGVGKSRLLAEFRKSLAYSRWKVGYGACLEFANRPYGPVLEALSRLDAKPFGLGAAATKREQLDAIVGRFAAIASRSASIVIVEDLHFADSATLDSLVHLGSKLHAMRLLVLASVRGDELYPDNPATIAVAKIGKSARAGRIDLLPLQGAELRRFIDEALGETPLPDQTRRAIAIAGEGNPFFTEELLKSAVERAMPNYEPRDRRALPPTVRATLLDRLRPFDESERRIVTQAAVIGRTFGLPLLASTLDMQSSTILSALRRARDFQIVEELDSQTFRFRHALTRQTIYEEFLGAEVRPRHRSIARALENAPSDRRSLEALAYHWWAAREADGAVTYNELAGDAAAGVHAHEDALGYYERALEFEMEAPRRASIVLKMADRRLALGLTKEAQAAYGSAADVFGSAGEHQREAACRATAAITAYGIGLPNPTAPLEAMLERLQPGEYVARSRVHLGLAWLAATFWFPTRAAEHLARVDRRALEEADIALRYHNVAAFVAMTLGEIENFRDQFAAWLNAAEATGKPQIAAGAHTNGAMCFSFFGLHDEAQAHLDSALRLSRQAQSRHSEETVHAFGVLCCLMRGDLVQAKAELSFVSPTSENRVNITFATAWGTVIGAALGDSALVETWFDAFEETIAAHPEVECGGGFAEIMVRRGRRHDAEDLLHRALPECELLRGNVVTLLAVARYGRSDDRAKARDYLRRAAEGERELVERPALALFDAILCGQQGRVDEAATLAREAAEGFRRLRCRYFEAQALEIAGERDAALAQFRRCGAEFDVRRLEGTTARDFTDPPVASVLSQREREIAALAASGLSNLEIARRLAITHKTVEKHLGSVYQKLRIASRMQLGAFPDVAQYKKL